MANYTPNYNLKKPLDSENYDIADQNGNMDLIDTALNTQNQAINALNSNIAKYLFSDVLSDSVAVNSDGNVIIDTPNEATAILAIIPYGFVPSDHWNATIAFNNVVVSTKTIYFRCIGSGNAQKFRVRYCVIYK